MKALDSGPWAVAVLLCATIGLAPFLPEPHVWEKLRMLAAGDLTRLIDIGDLFLHGFPWLLLLLKALRTVSAGRD